MWHASIISLSADDHRRRSRRRVRGAGLRGALAHRAPRADERSQDGGIPIGPRSAHAKVRSHGPRNLMASPDDVEGAVLRSPAPWRPRKADTLWPTTTTWSALTGGARATSARWAIRSAFEAVFAGNRIPPTPSRCTRCTRSIRPCTACRKAHRPGHARGPAHRLVIATNVYPGPAGLAAGGPPPPAPAPPTRCRMSCHRPRCFA